MAPTTTEVTPEENKPRRRWRKRIVLILLGLCTAGIMLGVGTYVALRSPAFFNLVKPYIQSIARDNAGVEFDFKSFALDLFGGVDSVGLQVRLQGDANALTVKLDHFKLEYHVTDLFNNNRALRIKKVTVKGLAVDGNVVAGAQEPQEKQVIEPAVKDPKKDLGPEIFAALPIALFVNKVSIDDVAIHVGFRDANQQMRLDLDAFQLATNFDVSRDGFAAQLVTRLGQSAADGVQIDYRLRDGTMAAKLNVALDFATEIFVGYEDKQWQIQQGPLTTQLTVSDLDLTQQKDANRLRVQIPKLTLKLENNFQGGVGEPVVAPAVKHPIVANLLQEIDAKIPSFVKELVFPAFFNLNQQLEISKIAFEQQVGVNETAIGLDFKQTFAMTMKMPSLPGIHGCDVEALATEIIIQNLALHQLQDGNQLDLTLGKMRLALPVELSEAQLKGSFDLDLTQIVFAPLGEHVRDISYHMPGRFHLLTSVGEAVGKLQVGKLPVMDLGVSLTPTKEEDLAVAIDLGLTLGKSLRQTLPMLKGLAVLGDLKIKNALSIILSRAFLKTFDANTLLDEGLPIHGNLALIQSAAPAKRLKGRVILGQAIGFKHKARVARDQAHLDAVLTLGGVEVPSQKLKLQHLELKLDARSDFKKHHLTTDLTVEKLHLAAVKSPLNIGFKNNLHATHAPIALDSNGALRLADRPLLDYQVKLRDRAQSLRLNADVGLSVNRSLAPFVAADVRRMVGELKLENTIAMTVSHPWPSIQSFDDANVIQVSLNTETQINQRKGTSRGAKKLVLQGPIQFGSTIQWDANHLSAATRLAIENVHMIPDIGLRGLHVSTHVSMETGLAPDHVRLAVAIRNGQIMLPEVERSIKVLPRFLRNLDVGLNVRAISLDKIYLDGVRVAIGDRFLTFHSQGKATVKAKNAQIDGALTVAIPTLFNSDYKMTGKGNLEVPFRVHVMKGEHLELNAGLRAEQVSIATDGIEVKDAQGGMSIQEHFTIGKDGRIRFSTRVDENPFKRVDYNRLQPILYDREQFTVGQINLLQKHIGPFTGRMSIRQNRLTAQRFSLQLFDGHVDGQFILNLEPKRLLVGLLCRVTRIDPHQMLPSIFKRKSGQKKRLSMRIAIMYQINKALIEGRIDVTEIGGEQLRTLVDVLDPEYEDRQLNQVRTALKIAYPTYVGLLFADGYLDVIVDIDGALSQRFSIRGLPLSAMLQAITNDLNQRLAQVPVGEL